MMLTFKKVKNGGNLMLSFEKVMEQSELGFARHKVIYDKEGKPVDYSFLSVNPAFERLTGLKKKELLNRRITEVMPKITDGNFDWIDFYGQIASNGERHVFEQYSTPLDRGYSVEAFLDDREGTNSYGQITHRMRRITGAKFVALNLFLEEKEKFRTSAVDGVSATLQMGLGFLGFNLFEKEWSPDPGCAERIKRHAVATFDHLHELTGDLISKHAIRLIEKTLKLGKTTVIKITQGERILGDFTIILSNESE